MKNSSSKAISLHIWIRVVGILLVTLYTFLLVIWYWIVGSITVEFVLFVTSLIGTAGVLVHKEWARKLLVAISGVGIVYILIDVIWVTGFTDNLSILFGVLFAATALFYQQPFVRTEFRKFPRILPWNILLIDDDKVLLKMMSTNFATQGVRLLTADSGEKGLSIAENKDLDLIILDVILPKMKGREVCVRLKENSRTKDVPIIFLTVKDSPDDIRAEMEAGAVSHFTKPVMFPDLFQEIKKILGDIK